MPIQILMPALSPTMTDGKLATWLVKEGDKVKAGDVMAEIETDKATMEVEAVDEGIIGKILVDSGTDGVLVNAPIAILLEDGEDASAIDGMDTTPTPAVQQDSPAVAAPTPTPAVQQESPPAAPKKPAPAVQQELASAAQGERIFASPLAKRLASQEGLDLSAIGGTGPKGRVVKRDIEAALASGTGRATSSPTPAVQQNAPAAIQEGAYRIEPNSMMRKVIASRLAESKRTIPHWYLTVECELDELLELRKKLNDNANGAYKISVNDLIIKAVALSMQRVPQVNTIWGEEETLFANTVDISVAVATPSGLVTPIIRDADRKGLADISTEMKELAGRAQENKLMPEEYQGGGFTISNLGMFGVKEFAPIVNPPQTAIMGIGAGEQRAIVKDGALAVATTMNCTISSDHRVVDGAVAAKFMQIFKGFIEAPLTMLL